MAGKSEILDQYAEDFRKARHDKPQSMCPASGSAREGLRMRRTATVLSVSACAVYPPDLRQPFSTALAPLGRLCALQLGNPRHRKAVSRTSATRSHEKNGRPRALTTRFVGHHPLCADASGAAPPAASGSRSTASGSSASDVPGSEFPTHRRGQGCPGRCDAPTTPARKWIGWPHVQGPRSGKSRRSDVTRWGEMFPRTPGVSEGCSRHRSGGRSGRSLP